MRSLFFLLLMFMALAARSQKSETVYRTKGDTLQNFYKTLLPDSASKGLILIMGGFCTRPDEIMLETKLPEKAGRAGYTVVLAYLVDDCSTIDSKNRYQSRLETLIPELMERYRIPKGRFIIGGQSLGGHRALFYTEMAYKRNDGKIIKPNAVFGVDPPLNMKRLWNSFVYGVNINFSEVSVAEGKEMLRRFRIMYGGSPAQQPKKYEEVSSSFETMNGADLSACISRLKLLGNEHAEFVNCLGKGFKPDGQRHPHYFSMLDPDEFLLWAGRMLLLNKK